MRNAIIFCFLFVFLEREVCAEEYRVDDGTVLVERNENYVKFEYTPDNYTSSYVTYIYFLRGDDHGFKELIIHRSNGRAIIILANVSDKIVQVDGGAGSCYCIFEQCEVLCGMGRILFRFWTDRLQISIHI